MLGRNPAKTQILPPVGTRALSCALVYCVTPCHNERVSSRLRAPARC